MKECDLYESEGEKVRCNACAHRCSIAEGNVGICGVRKNVNGMLNNLVYERIAAMHIDPIEKKPLYHFLPGSQALSIGTVGCNFGCAFCQNADISFPREKKEVTGDHVTVSQLVDAAENNGCASIAYTYNEPIIFIEMVVDAAKEAKRRGIRNVMVSNGFWTEESVEMLKDHIDAVNIDLKSMRDGYYREVCRARLQPVLDTIRWIHEAGIWMELTTLIVPGENDSIQELTDIAGFIADVDPHIPWHISRFFPMYQMDKKEPTPVVTLQKAAEIGRRAGLKYIYMGNIGDSVATFCPECGEKLIERDHREGRTLSMNVQKCANCGNTIPGVYA